MDFIEVDSEGLCIGIVGAFGFGLFLDGFVLSVCFILGGFILGGFILGGFIFGGFIFGGFIFGGIGLGFRFRSRLFWAFLLHRFDRFIEGPIA